MGYVVKGDLVSVSGRAAVAVSDAYTKMVYDDYDFELQRGGYEGGSAVPYVDVVMAETGRRASVPLTRVVRLTSLDS